jgi:hypothetical protein
MGKYSRLWLIITGVILLAVGGAMAVALGGIPFAGGAMLLTGAILGGVGILLIVIGLIVGRRAAAVDQILATGIPGTAQITGLSQTGMYINYQPQIQMNLLVSLPGRPPYGATHKEVVPLILLSRLAPGAMLAVKVDPADPQKIVIDWQNAGQSMMGMQMAGMQPMGQPMPGMQPMGTAASQAASTTGVDESLSQVQAALASSGMAAANPYATAAQGSYTVEQLRQYLRTSGLQATATVDSLEDSGQIVGDERLFTMEMTLNIPGQAPKKLAKSGAMVPMLSAHKLRQGMTVPVRYAAENPDLLMVEWDKI